MTKTCIRCNIEKDLDSFPWKNKKLLKKDGTCKECHKFLSKEHYKTRTSYYKEKAKKSNSLARTRSTNFLREFLLGHPCIDCGEKDIFVLEFDHINGKDYNISSLLSGSISRLQKEISRCEVRCANCHTRRHLKQRGTWR